MFMSDLATAFGVLALLEAPQRAVWLSVRRGRNSGLAARVAVTDQDSKAAARSAAASLSALASPAQPRRASSRSSPVLPAAAFHTPWPPTRRATPSASRLPVTILGRCWPPSRWKCRRKRDRDYGVYGEQLRRSSAAVRAARRGRPCSRKRRRLCVLDKTLNAPRDHNSNKNQEMRRNPDLDFVISC
jgi:hypothetical protein